MATLTREDGTEFEITVLEKSKPVPSNTGVFVGASPEGVKEARAVIIEILNSRADNRTKRLALRTLTQLCKVENAQTNITNCSFSMGG